MNMTVLFAVLALVCYSVANVLLKHPLSSYHPAANMFIAEFMFLMISVTVFVVFRVTKPDLAFPPIAKWWIIALWAVTAYLGGYMLMLAYNRGGSLMVVSMVVILVPPLSSVMAISFGQKVPSKQELFGWALVACGLFLVSYSKTPKVQID